MSVRQDPQHGEREFGREVEYCWILQASEHINLTYLKVLLYTEAKVDVTQEIEQRAQWSAPAWAACGALCFISCVTSTLASVYALEYHIATRWRGDLMVMTGCRCNRMIESPPWPMVR